jgi:hypothetical protein
MVFSAKRIVILSIEISEIGPSARRLIACVVRLPTAHRGNSGFLDKAGFGLESYPLGELSYRCGGSAGLTTGFPILLRERIRVGASPP